MKQTLLINMTAAFVALFGGSVAYAAEPTVTMLKTCKSECPNAKSEHQAHECMKKIASEKKDDKKFKTSKCFAALQEHEAHEKDGEHKH
jgi:hypothetical protein